MKAFLHRPQSTLLRRALFQVHLWVGVLAGLYILVVCTTGAALVFRIDMQRALHPHLFTPSADGPLADPATVLDKLRTAYPGSRISGIDAPTTARPTYLAYISDTDQRFLTLLIDPVSAEPLGELPERSLVRTLQDLHFDLLAGRTGRVVNGAGAGCLLIMSLTGLIIWWPGMAGWRRALTVDVTRPWKRVNRDLHTAVGIWSVAVIAMWAVTGIYFAFPSQFREAVGALSPLTITRPPESGLMASQANARPTWRALIERSRLAAPGQHVARVVVPSSDRAAFLVLFSDVSPTPAGTANLRPVYLDQFTGALLADAPPARRTIGDIVMAWVAPLHVGNFGGNAVRVAWLVLGLTPPLLFITGFIMWWLRVLRPRMIRAQKPEEVPGGSKVA